MFIFAISLKCQGESLKLYLIPKKMNKMVPSFFTALIPLCGAVYTEGIHSRVDIEAIKDLLQL